MTETDAELRRLSNEVGACRQDVKDLAGKVDNLLIGGNGQEGIISRITAIEHNHTSLVVWCAILGFLQTCVIFAAVLYWPQAPRQRQQDLIAIQRPLPVEPIGAGRTLSVNAAVNHVQARTATRPRTLD